MSKSTKLKEAFKTALAFAAVFGIALQADWMNPYWAGWAVAVVALPTAGASIQKGLLRILGTIPGCSAALVIHALAVQDRWTFMLLACGWMFFTSYMMVRKERDSYFWVMAGYVCLMILLSDVDSSANMFESAVFRTVETVMGVVVYTLIAVFLWPQTNLGAIKKQSAELTGSLHEIYRSGRDTLLGCGEQTVSFQELQGKVVQQLAQFRQILQAEGSESYEVKELRHLWERFHGLSLELLETMGRWQSEFVELNRIDLRRVLPELQSCFAELDSRFAALETIFAAEAQEYIPLSIGLEVAPGAAQGLSSFDRGAIEVLRKELLHLDRLTAELLECAGELKGNNTRSVNANPRVVPGLRSQISGLPVPDWDHLRSAAFVAVTTGVGFLIWILFDPPGHSGWFQLTGTIALLVAAVPSMRASRMIMPVAVTSAFCLAIYVFIMPQLSSFIGLGSLLFGVMFLNCYFLSGMARFFCSMAILNMLQIQNPQIYSFAAMANVYIFLVMGFTFLFVMSYLLGSPRPEKVVLKLLKRFFRSAEYLMSRKAPEIGTLSFLERWITAFHLRQLHSLPTKIAAWGKGIDQNHFPGNPPERVQALVASTQTLVYRLEQFLDTGVVYRTENVCLELREDVKTWHAGIEDTFGRWSRTPEAERVAPLKERLEKGLVQLERRIESVVNRDGDNVGRQEGETFFHLIGGYRGVSEAALAYAGVAEMINWDHWREERFS